MRINVHLCTTVDIDRVLTNNNKMDSKTYVIGDSANNSNGIISALAPFLQQRGVDASTLALMNNGGFGNNGGWLWIILIALLWGNNGFGGGFGGGANGAGFLSNQLANTSNTDLLMQALQGNKDAISSLSSTLGADFTQVSNALNTINTQLCSIGKDVGMSSMEVINAIQQGNMTLVQQLSNGFSQVNLSMCQQTNALQNSICDAKSDIKNGLTMLGFQGERQTNTLTQAINASTQRIVDGQTAQEIRELNALLAAKQTEIAELKAAVSTRQIVDVALAPVLAQLATLTANAGATATKAAGA